MRIAYDSNDMPAGERIESIRRRLFDTFVGFDCIFADEAPRLVIDGHAVGHRNITRITSTRHDVERSPTLIKRDEREILFFGLVLQGRAAILQNGREIVMEPGMFAFNDTSRPFRTCLGEASDVCWLGVPKALVADRVPRLEDMAAVGFAGSEPIRRATFAFLAGLDAAIDAELSSDAIERLVAIGLDLLVETMVRGGPRTSFHYLH